MGLRGRAAGDPSDAPVQLLRMSPPREAALPRRWDGWPMAGLVLGRPSGARVHITEDEDRLGGEAPSIATVAVPETRPPNAGEAMSRSICLGAEQARTAPEAQPAGQ
mmetsp:Transcript_57085/g.145156  ORF Transcript_57085/g.145156 Transcript_57085/m.145156 type:complete len:107 (-) Transcript_57085:1222-1542(-)